MGLRCAKNRLKWVKINVKIAEKAKNTKMPTCQNF